MRQRLVRAAVERVIRRNELAHTAYLIEWLEGIADDFGSHGLPVDDLRELIGELRAQLESRRGSDGPMIVP